MAEHLITSFGENWTQVSRVAFVHVRRKPGLSLPHRATDMDVLFSSSRIPWAQPRRRDWIDGIALPPSAAWPAVGYRGQIRRTWWRPRVPTAQTKPKQVATEPNPTLPSPAPACHARRGFGAATFPS
jgi:hypothetical protein